MYRYGAWRRQESDLQNILQHFDEAEFINFNLLKVQKNVVSSQVGINYGNYFMKLHVYDSKSWQ